MKEIFPNSTYADDKNCYEFRGYNAGEKRFVHAEDGFNYARVYDNLPKLENGDITLESLLYQTDSHGVHETDEYFWYFLDGSSAKMNRGNCMRNVEKERQIAGWMPRDNYIAVSSYDFVNITLHDYLKKSSFFFGAPPIFTERSGVNIGGGPAA